MTDKKPINKTQKIESQVKVLLNKMSGQVKELKRKYDNLDEGQKKRLLKGVGAAAAVLAGIGLAARIVKSKTGRK